MSTVTTTSRTASTTTPILDVLAERWSPRAFDSTQPLAADALDAPLEAARWSPSAGNSQPWRFLVTRRGTAEFQKVESSLIGFNSAWAGSAGALVVALAETADEDGTARPWATYDVGQAVAHFSIQAHAAGLHVHQMAGFDADSLRDAFDLPAKLTPITVSAIGAVGSPELLPEKTRERETAPRTRKPLEDILIPVR